MLLPGCMPSCLTSTLARRPDEHKGSTLLVLDTVQVTTVGDLFEQQRAHLPGSAMIWTPMDAGKCSASAELTAAETPPAKPAPAAEAAANVQQVHLEPQLCTADSQTQDGSSCEAPALHSRHLSSE